MKRWQKVTFFSGVVILSTCLLLGQVIDAEKWAYITGLAMTLMAGANIGEHYIRTKNGKGLK